MAYAAAVAPSPAGVESVPLDAAYDRVLALDVAADRAYPADARSTMDGFAVRAADRIVVMMEGQILSDGAPAEALTSDALAKAYAVDAHWVAGQSGPLLDVIARRGLS